MNIRQFLKHTIVGGVFFLFPLVVVVIILGKASELVQALVKPIASRIPEDAILGVGVELILTTLILLAVCFFAGLIAKTPLGNRFISKLENSVLSNIPGYEFIKGLGESMAQVDKDGSVPVLVKFDDNWQFAFLIESLPDGMATIFVPDAPSPWSGAVMVVEESRLTPLPHGDRDMLKTLKSLGYGTAELLSPPQNT